MAFPRIYQVSIATGDINRSLAFFRDYVGMDIIGDRYITYGELGQLWDLPSGTTARSVLLRQRQCSTLLEVLQFHSGTSRTIRDGANNWDYGIFNLGFVVENLDSIYKELISLGHKAFSSPVIYAPMGNEVKEVIIMTPDDVPVVHLDRMTQNYTEGKARYIRLNHSLVIVEDAERTANFYREVIGLRETRRERLTGGAVDTVLALPAGTESRLHFVAGSDPDQLYLILMELSVKGTSLAPVARPPNRGIFSITFEVADIVETLKRAESWGIVPDAGPHLLSGDRHGKVETAVLRCPGGVLLELIKR